MKKININNVIISFNNYKKPKRVLSSKTKFLDNYLYKCKGLDSWIRYRDYHFRWEEVLYFLDIPIIGYEIDLIYFSEKVQEKFNGNFYQLLFKVQHYFNCEDQKLYEKRLKDFNIFRSITN